MILADKIIELRKKCGYSQEELANLVNVSRQAISKWETAQSVPDLDKIIALSKIFSVSTDYLLKDDLEEATKIETDFEKTDLKKVSLSMANEYLTNKFHTSKWIALGSSLCIVSPITLIILTVLAEMSKISEVLAISIGLSVLVILVSIAISLFIISGSKVKEFEFLNTEEFETEYGVTGFVKSKKQDLKDTYYRFTIFGIIICVLSSIPLFISLAFESNLNIVIGTCSTIFIVAIGVFLIVNVGCKMGAIQRLLQEGDYDKKRKKNISLYSAVSGPYWLITTAIYLGWGFITENWDKNWIVWVVAPVLYCALYSVMGLFTKNKK